MKLSACLIVRNNEHTIDRCLGSLRAWVDEIVVVDTGSRDRTELLAQAYGARLFRFRWRDDFSAARNFSIRHAIGEWIFWMDSDDYLPEESGRRLRAIADSDCPSSILAFLCQVHCRNQSRVGFDDITVVDQVKLFRNLPCLRFEGRIHEQLLPSIRREGGQLHNANIQVVHYGSDLPPKAMANKIRRDFRILKKEFRSRPEDPFVRFNLGMTAFQNREFSAAIDWFDGVLQRATGFESYLRKTYSLLIASLTQEGRHDEAERRGQQALTQFPADMEILFRVGSLRLRCSRFSEAVACYSKILNERDEPHYLNADLGISSFKARHNLALAYEGLGNYEAAEREWRLVTITRSDFGPSWIGLAMLLIRQQRFSDAKNIMARMPAVPSTRSVNQALGMALESTETAI